MPIRPGQRPNVLELIPAAEQLQGDLPSKLREAQYDTGAIDAVMAERGVGDARSLLKTAVKLFPGDQIIGRDELERAADFMLSPARCQLGGDLDPALSGYRWCPDDVDAAMHRSGVGDARAVIRAAIAIDDGDRFLDLDELNRAAKRLGRRRAGDLQASPSVIADVMRGTGIASESALLAEGTRHDRNHDRILSRDELEAAARAIEKITAPHDVAGILHRIEALRDHPEVEVAEIGRVGDQPIQALRFAPNGPGPWVRVLVTAGVHGDEPCGPGAAMLLVEQLLQHPGLRTGIEITVVPLVNPRGTKAGTRRNLERLDLNRIFDGEPGGPREVRAIEELLTREPFDLVLDLHSGRADRNGFWVLHAGAEDLLGPAVKRFGERWPLLHGDTISYDLSQPGLGRSDNANTLKGLAAGIGARWSATLEAPGSVSYLDQVIGENELVLEILMQARAHGVA